MITRSRGYLPHFTIPDGTYFLTFRLYDSLPQSVYLQFRQEYEMKQRNNAGKRLFFLNEYERKVEKYLDASCGQCWLRDPRIATLFLAALKQHNNQWYTLHAYTVMPNHVHILFSSNERKTLGEIIQRWKGNSSFHSNKVLQRCGTFWQREYFDRTIKSQRQFEFVIRYIFMNPVKAGLCKEVFQWPWTGASPEILYLLKRFFV